jgi:hypothetical protein
VCAELTMKYIQHRVKYSKIAQPQIGMIFGNTHKTSYSQFTECIIYNSAYSYIHFHYSLDTVYKILSALVAQWLALLTSDLEGPGSNPE